MSYDAGRCPRIGTNGTHMSQNTLIPIVIEKSGPSPAAELLDLASDEALKKLAKFLALDLHPDRGGSHKAFIRANELLIEIKNARSQARSNPGNHER